MAQGLKIAVALAALAAATPAAAAYYDFEVTVTSAYVCQGVDYVCANVGGPPFSFRQRWLYGEVTPETVVDSPHLTSRGGSADAQMLGGLDPSIVPLAGISAADTVGKANFGTNLFLGPEGYYGNFYGEFRADAGTADDKGGTFFSTSLYRNVYALAPHYGDIDNAVAGGILQALSQPFQYEFSIGYYATDGLDGPLTDYYQLSYYGTAVLIGGRPEAHAVPEPATWALMICGFGLAGAALRRRRAATAPAS